ncbi:helix-turn-helix domain-containing protein [Ferruginibacter sp.]
MEKTIHQGRNVKRFREMLGIKQDALAIDMGDDWNQQKISLLEQKENIDDKLLQQIAGYLKVPVDAIRNFDEEAAVNIISTNYDNAIGYQKNEHCNFNPLDKFVEAMEENKKLYERLLQSEKEKVELLQKVLDGKK